MSGGIFVKGIEKTRPGTYINFESTGKTQTNLSNQGTVVIPMTKPNWGPAKKFIEISNINPNSQFAQLGYDIDSAELLIIRETLKAANKVLVYIPSEGAKATVTLGGLIVTAKYGGTLGNDIKVTISDNPVLGKDIKIYLKEKVIYEAEKIVSVANLPLSEMLTFTGNGALTNSAAISLVGGTSILPTNSDLMQFLDDCETQEWNAMCFPLTDSSLIAAFDSKIQYFNYTIGKSVSGVRPKASIPADNEYIITVRNGIVLPGNVILTPEQSCGWVAGSTAAAQVNQSLTGVNYPYAIDVSPRLTHIETITGLNAGEFIFSIINKEVVVEQDINSFTSFKPTKNNTYRKNRVIRVFQKINTAGSEILKPNKYDGDEDGYNLAKQDLLNLLVDLEKLKAVTNVDLDNDITIETNLTEGESFYATIAVQPVDSIEKFYLTVKNS